MALNKQKLVIVPRGHCMLILGQWQYYFPNDYYDLLWSFEASVDLFRKCVSQSALLASEFIHCLVSQSSCGLQKNFDYSQNWLQLPILTPTPSTLWVQFLEYK